MSAPESRDVDAATERFRQLSAVEILKTSRRLTLRIGERFPGSGLSRVARELEQVVAETDDRCRWISRPMIWLRVGVAAVVAAITVLLVLGLFAVRVGPGSLRWTELVQVLEAALNDLVLIGLAIAFLVTVETRLKRRRALRSLHELRALAHVIDMHQLTKDPERVLAGARDNTPSSPQRTLTPFELVRYLDYSSELLALIGKSAALYAQYLGDPVVLASVNEIEHLATGLSRKIWQKITSVGAYGPRPGASDASGVGPADPATTGVRAAD